MYRIRSSGDVKTRDEIRALHPNASLPSVWNTEVCNDLDIDPILETPAPATTRFQSANKTGVEQDSLGNWVWTWTVTDWDQTAIDAATESQGASVRADRNRRLSESDWTQVADAPVDQAAWAVYRQALRDVPNQTGFPWDITWPETP